VTNRLKTARVWQIPKRRAKPDAFFRPEEAQSTRPNNRKWKPGEPFPRLIFCFPLPEKTFFRQGGRFFWLGK